MRFFKINENTAEPIEAQIQSPEEELQRFFEKNLRRLLGVRFLKSKYQISNGEMDTIGIDKKNRPVIIEYKQAKDKNQVSQITRYARWLKKNERKFTILVSREIDHDTAEKINLEKIRLICIASEFNADDKDVVEEQQNYQIELIRYGILDDDILLLEQIAGDSGLDELPSPRATAGTQSVRGRTDNTFQRHLERADTEVKARFNNLRQFLKSLGDDVAAKEMKFYFAFIRRHNFADINIRSRKGTIIVFANLNPDDLILEDGFTRSVRNVGHHGNGDLEISINNDDDLEKAKPLLERSYQNSG